MRPAKEFMRFKNRSYLQKVFYSKSEAVAFLREFYPNVYATGAGGVWIFLVRSSDGTPFIVGEFIMTNTSNQWILRYVEDISGAIPDR